MIVDKQFGLVNAIARGVVEAIALYKFHPNFILGCHFGLDGVTMPPTQRSEQFTLNSVK